MFYTNLERTYRCPLAVYINVMLNGEFVFHTCISVYTDCITNFKVCNVCKQEDTMVSLAQRKWTWIGHVIGKDPREEKTKGCPKTTWRRSAEKELNTYIWPGRDLSRLFSVGRDWEGLLRPIEQRGQTM